MTNQEYIRHLQEQARIRQLEAQIRAADCQNDSYYRDPNAGTFLAILVAGMLIMGAIWVGTMSPNSPFYRGETVEKVQ